MSFVVVYDACVLYPSTMRDLLIRIAQAGLVQAKWTEQILDEVFDSLQKDRPDLEPAKLDRTRVLMIRAVRDCLVTGYEPLIPSVSLPDPDDRHVCGGGDPGAGADDRDEQPQGLPGREPGRVGHRSADGRRVHPRPDRPQP